jgi:hypothetical protein
MASTQFIARSTTNRTSKSGSSHVQSIHTAAVPYRRTEPPSDYCRCTPYPAPARLLYSPATTAIPAAAGRTPTPHELNLLEAHRVTTRPLNNMTAKLYKSDAVIPCCVHWYLAVRRAEILPQVQNYKLYGWVGSAHPMQCANCVIHGGPKCACSAHPCKHGGFHKQNHASQQQAVTAVQALGVTMQ